MTVATPPYVPPRYWGRRILLSALGLLLLIWAAPMVAAWTPLVTWVCSKATNYIHGSVSVGSVSLGWFSPIVLYNVEVRDAQDQVVAQIPRVQGDRSLLMLLCDPSDLGSFRLEKPKVDVTFAGNESNVEKVLEKLLHPPAAQEPSETSPTSELPQIRLEVVDATLDIRDADTKQQWFVRLATFNMMRLNDDRQTLQLNVQGALHDGVEPGKLKAEMNLQTAPDGITKATVKGRFSSFPLALANVFLRRYQPDTVVGGSLQGQGTITAAINAGTSRVEIAGELSANHFTLSTPALADTLFIERIKLPCTLRFEGPRLIAERAELQSDFGTVIVQGVLDRGAGWRAALDQPNFDLTVDANLALLAQRLPKTLHLHPDLRLTDGRLNLSCKSELKDGAIVWQGKLHTSDIRGIKATQTIAWTEPMTLAFQVRDLTKGVPLIDELRCSARFLHVDASTTADQFTLTANADLQQLAEPLGQFIDLKAVKLAGKAKGEIQIRRLAEDHFQLQGNAQLRQMNLTWKTTKPWQEEAVTAQFAALGRIGAKGEQRIDSASAMIHLANDVVTAKLMDPITDLVKGPWATLEVSVVGDLARWHKRVSSWTTALDDWHPAGQADLQMQLRPAPGGIEFTKASLQAKDFRFTGRNLWIQEPTLNVETNGGWDAGTGDLELTRTTLTCATVAFDADQLSLRPATMTLRGAVSLSGDLARLRAWTHDPRSKPAEPLQGYLAGRVEFATTQDRVAADFTLTLKDVLYGTSANPTWREPKVQCVGRGVYVMAQDALQFEKLNLGGATFNVNARGKIANVTTSTDIDLAGMLTYDLEKIETQLRPLLGKDVKIAGKDERGFKIAGSLYPKSKLNPLALSVRDLKGDAALHWKSLHALGCDIGPADLKAVVQQGWLQFYSIETTLNGGKLRLQPNVKLEPGPLEMILLAGPVIEKAKITPEMCAGALGFAMPMLANVTEAEGSISLTLEGGRIPLATPTLGEVKGVIVLHHAKAGPNAIVRELSSLLKIASPSCVVKECKVPFHMAGGKVHHSDLEIAFGDLTLKSSGAVGLDGSLAMVIEMPIPPTFAAAAKLTPAQAQQTIRIPIGGTVNHPRVDGRALESLTSVLGRSILENQLNKLLQPK